MTSLKHLIDRGVASVEDAHIYAWRDEDGEIRYDLWSEPGFPPSHINCISLTVPSCTVIRLHWGRRTIAVEDAPRIKQLVRLELEVYEPIWREQQRERNEAGEPRAGTAIRG